MTDLSRLVTAIAFFVVATAAAALALGVFAGLVVRAFLWAVA